MTMVFRAEREFRCAPRRSAHHNYCPEGSLDRGAVDNYLSLRMPTALRDPRNVRRQKHLLPVYHEFESILQFPARRKFEVAILERLIVYPAQATRKRSWQSQPPTSSYSRAGERGLVPSIGARRCNGKLIVMQHVFWNTVQLSPNMQFDAGRSC